MNTTQLMYLAMEAKETYFALARVVGTRSAKHCDAERHARERWNRREAKLQQAIEEECARA